MLTAISGLHMTTRFREFDVRRKVATSTYVCKCMFVCLTCITQAKPIQIWCCKHFPGAAGRGRKGLWQEAAGRFWSHPAAPQPFEEPSQAIHSPRGLSVQCITVLPKRSVNFPKNSSKQNHYRHQRNSKQNPHSTTSPEESWSKRWKRFITVS